MKIRLTKKLAGLVIALATSAACSAGGPVGDEGKPATVSQESGSANMYCKTTSDCSDGFYCSLDGTECTHPEGCVGQCLLDDRARCGDSVCDTGQVCCNASCGICAAPGESCTQQLCRQMPSLKPTQTTATVQ